jgi:hypothetical protein
MIVTRSSLHQLPIHNRLDFAFWDTIASCGGLLKVPKPDFDEMVKALEERSPQAGNPNAPGRKAAKR